MERRGIGIEVKVGLFVFLGLVVLGYMALRVNKTKLNTVEGYTLTVFFDSVSGLVKNSPVQIAGIEVGRVKDIALKDGRAQVDHDHPQWDTDICRRPGRYQIAGRIRR